MIQKSLWGRPRITNPVAFLICFRLTSIQLEGPAEDTKSTLNVCLNPTQEPSVGATYQQEFPSSRALSGVLVPVEEEAESWEPVMFPSSTPRPCRHAVGRQTTQNPQLSSTFLGEVQQATIHRSTFFFTVGDDLEVFGDIGTWLFLHGGVGKAERTLVAHLSVAGKDAFHGAAPCRTASSPGETAAAPPHSPSPVTK